MKLYSIFGKTLASLQLEDKERSTENW